MCKWKAWLLIGLVVLTGAFSMGSDCNVRLDSGGLRVNTDDEEHGFFHDLADFFD